MVKTIYFDFAVSWKCFTAGVEAITRYPLWGPIKKQL